MYALSDSARSESDGCSHEQDDITQEPFAIQDRFSYGNIGWNRQLTRINFNGGQLIKLANDKLSLADIFQKHHIIFNTDQPSPSGWLPAIVCPFKDHQDSSPSFGFNPEQNAFNCFGCHRGGKSVQFLAYLEGRSQLEIAQQILKDTSTIEEIVEEIDLQNQEKITQILVEYGNLIREFVQEHQSMEEATAYVDAVGWSLDLYLRAHTSNASIDIKCLTAIIEKIKHQLSLFGETE